MAKSDIVLDPDLLIVGSPESKEIGKFTQRLRFQRRFIEVNETDNSAHVDALTTVQMTFAMEKG